MLITKCENTQCIITKQGRSTLSDVGCFRQLTIGGGGAALKSTPPPYYDFENYNINLHHIINVHFTRCFRQVPVENFQKFAILTILQRFQNKKIAKIVVKIIYFLFC